MTEPEAATPEPMQTDNAALAASLYGETRHTPHPTDGSTEDGPRPDDDVPDTRRAERRPVRNDRTLPADVKSVQIDTSSLDDGSFDAAVVETFGKHAAELGLEGEKAQALFDKMAPALQQQQVEAVEKARYDLAQQAGKEFGADLKAVVSDARRALQTTEHGPALADFLDETGLGSHPVVLRFLREISQWV